MKLPNLTQDTVKTWISMKEPGISKDRISSFYKGTSTNGKVTLIPVPDVPVGKVWKKLKSQLSRD